MVTAKGTISDDVETKQGFNWLKEIIEKAKKDALNVSQEEYDLAKRLLHKFEKNCKAWDIIESELTQKQWIKVWKGYNK